MANDLPPDSAEMVRILTKRTNRGIIGFNVLRFGCYAWLIFSIFTQDYSAAAGAFLSSILFAMALDHVRKRNKVLRLVATKPGLVYWGHASIVTEVMLKHPAGNISPVTVHLRTGEQVEATLPPDDAKAFTDWLSRKNPTMRWGAFDEGA